MLLTPCSPTIWETSRRTLFTIDLSINSTYNITQLKCLVIKVQAVRFNVLFPLCAVNASFLSKSQDRPVE